VIALLTVVILAGTLAFYFLRTPRTPAVLETSKPAVREQPSKQPVARRPVVPVPARSLEKAPGETKAGTGAAQETAVSAAPVQEQGGQIESWARELIETLRSAGETGGILVYPPPGTVPIKIGIVVPEDFELPEGYVRYHQITDSGQRLEPILMFSPDYEFVDANGEPIELPEDGVVPPEMAPSGLPLRMLEVPQDSRRAGDPRSR
jgi:hypothetical protein